MPQKTDIEWTDYTSNPIRAEVGRKRGWHCEKVSAGCAHCYAETINHRFGTQKPYTRASRDRVKPVLVEDELRKLLTMQSLSGRKVFLCDMTDLFGEWVPDEWIDRIFTVMSQRSDVTFQILTKRPERMRQYNWNLSNAWLGTSVEDQNTADERIPELLRCQAAVRFLSCEPLLAPTDLDVFLRYTTRDDIAEEAARVPLEQSDRLPEWESGIDLVLIGGESGPGARPCDLDWIRGLIRQCREAGVKAYVKQVGANAVQTFPTPCQKWPDSETDYSLAIKHPRGGDPAEWPEDLRVREWPGQSEDAAMSRKSTKGCVGCRDHYYNIERDGCWMLPKAKMVKRYRLGWWVRPTLKSAFTEVDVYDCHNAPGEYALYEELPACAK